MEFIFIILSWVILLVPGFDDSVPPTGDKIFKIEISPDIVQSIKIQSDDSFDFSGLNIQLKQNSTGTLEIKIPKNLPTPASNIGFWAYDSRAYVLVNGADINYDLVEDPCYSHYKIPIDGKTNLEIVYPVIAAGSWQLYTPIQFDEDNPCYNVVFYKKTFDSPLKQFKDSISKNDFVCKDGLFKMIKIDGKYSCVTSKTADKLLLRGWAICDDEVDYGRAPCGIHSSGVIPFDKGLSNEKQRSIIPQRGYHPQQTFPVEKDGQTFNVNYNMTGGVLYQGVFEGNVSSSLILSIYASDDGNLTITLPRELIDAKEGYCPHDPKRPDDQFFVLVGKEEVNYKEIQTNSENRTLSILVPKDTSGIEIISTCWV